MAAKKLPHPPLYWHFRLAGARRAATSAKCRTGSTWARTAATGDAHRVSTTEPPYATCISWPASEASRSRCALLPHSTRARRSPRPTHAWAPHFSSPVMV